MGKNKKKVRGKKTKKLKLLTSKDLVKMTDNFSEKNFIGTFQFGKLYRGSLKDQHFTIKTWVPPTSEYCSMKNHECRLGDELIMLRHQRLVHPCIVSLYGYCRDRDHFAVVYNLKAMDSLLNLFLKEDFTWAQRIKVALSLAYLLKFFHDRFGDLDPFVIRNLSPAHVILDQEYNPKLVDFSMITGGIFPNRHVYTTQPAYGCVGYWDREIFIGGEHLALWTEKSDVFAFGVMLLSLLSKKVLNLEMDDPCFVEDWAHEEYEKDCKSLVHESLQADPGFYAIDGSELSKLGVDCTSDNRKVRPTMEKVVHSFLALRVSIDHRKLLGLKKLFYLNKKLYPTVSLDMGKSKKHLRDTQIDSFSYSMTKDIFKFKVRDLQTWTNKFSEENYIGRFQFGKLFRGVYKKSICEDMRHLVVKIWDDCQTLEDNILRLGDEMLLLHHERYICHPGLARMFGYCIEDEYVAIVLYFEPMDSIRNLLLKDHFTWINRIKVACGVASLLKFLHDVSHRMDPFIIRNLDVAHILLDKDFNPKLFDLSHITGGIYPNRPMNVVNASLGWHEDQVEPNYDTSGFTGTWTTKSDVFSFGVLFLCLISKISNVASLVYDSGGLTTSNDIETLVHESLQKDPTYNDDDGREITRLVLQCVQNNSDYRPTMCDVFEALEKLHGVQIDADVMYVENMFRNKCAIEAENPYENFPKKHFMSNS